MTVGMILGKFLPPHAGHLYLAEFARRFADELIIVVGTLANEPIPGELRFQWMRELVPSARVVHLTDENPQDPSEHPAFWDIWRESLLRVLPRRPDLVFASETYGARLARELGATFVPVDPARSAIPVRATDVRRDLRAGWAHLPPPVRAHFTKRICIFGPESTGKTTLAEGLAAHYQTAWVPEYARTLLEHRDGEVEAGDMLTIARGQLAAEDALARTAGPVLFCDTDALATTIWSRALFGACDPTLDALATSRRYDLHLLLDVDVPFVEDPVRYLPERRAEFFALCEHALRTSGRRYVTLSGAWDDRFTNAVAAIDALLAEPTDLA